MSLSLLNSVRRMSIAVELPKTKQIAQAEYFPKITAMGRFEILALGESFQVKRICVKPAAALSLQSHKHRSSIGLLSKVEHGLQLVMRLELHEGQSVYVPLGVKHRLENPGKQLMVLIEVQIGTYLGEDDIIRYDDVYARD